MIIYTIDMDIILNYLHSGFTQIFSFVILLGVLVFVHELGHFIVARLCGVRVEVFSLGFGKKIFEYVKDGTNYCISIIPLGGYVKMYGEQPGDEIPESEKIYSYTHKPVHQRLAVVLAGPIMNLIFAFIIFMLIAGLGEMVKGPKLGEVNPGSEAEQLNLKSGDKVIKVGDQEIKSWDDFQNALNKYKNTRTNITVEDESNLTHDVLINIKSKKNPNVVSLEHEIGDIPGLSMYNYAAVVTIANSSPLKNLGLLNKDRIVKLNEIEILSFKHLEASIKKLNDVRSMNLPVPIKLLISRDEFDSNKKKEFEINYTWESSNSLTLGALGLGSTQLYIDKVQPNSPAEKAGLISGDQVVSINDKKLSVWDDLLNSVKSFDGKDLLKLKIIRDGLEKDFDVVPNLTTQMTPHGTEEKRYTIGISPYLMYSQPDLILIKYTGFVNIVNRAWTKTWDVSIMTVMSFVKLLQAELSPKNIGGIFSIAQAANETFKIGLTAFLQMMALISINLFILNLLPIPMLDGGHVIFYLIEAIKGTPLSLNKLELAHKIGMVLLFTLMIFALFNDFRRMLGFM